MATPALSNRARPARSGFERRIACLALLVAVTTSSAAFAAFGFEDVAKRAQELATKPYEDPTGRVPHWLTEISYDQWRDIRFRPERALWREADSRFTVQLFHLGLLYERPVTINVIEAHGVAPLAFSPSQFDYGRNEFVSRIPQDLGHAGFRLHYPLNRPDYFDEIIVFLGATYFRAVGKAQVFGASARGLAIDTAVASGEEFPWFREFWLVRPSPNATEAVIYALLDSPSLTGVYRFVVWPGDQTKLEIRLRLYPRKPVQKLGIAPLTSMFFFGENTNRQFDDFHPEVHDSDGLLIASASGEWIWRPLDNPTGLHLSSHVLQNPKGFGLGQRDRNFDHYQDLETRPDLRPSAWVAPRGEWGEGHVELVEIPTNADMNDNVAAFWVPKRPVEPGAPMDFEYDLYWYLDDRARPPGGRAVATRRERGSFENAQRFVVDFEGGRLETLGATTVVRGVITVASGAEVQEELLEQHVVKNPITGGWRLSFQVRPRDGEKPLELRAFLQKGDDVLTETWSYAVRP